MTIAWALLALAVAFMPGPSPTRARVTALASRERMPGLPPAAAAQAGRPPGAVWAISGAVVVGVVVALAGMVLGVAFALAAATGAYVAARAWRARNGQRRLQTLLAALRLIVAEFEAGGSASAAFAGAADASPEHRLQFIAAAQACSHGDPPRWTDSELEPLGHAWQLAAVTGAPVAAAIGRVADDVAARLGHRRTVAVAVSGAQASALMLAALPVLGIVLGVAMGASPVAVLFQTPTGRVLCLLGVALDCAGVLWTARLTARAARP